MHHCENTKDWIGHDCYVREDMFDNPACVWKFGLINRKYFAAYDQNNLTFLLIRQLAEIRWQNKLIQSGSRTLLCPKNNGLWCALIHGTADDQPLFIAMNLGTTPVLEEALKIPNYYGEFCGVDMLINISGGVCHFVEGSMRIKLPPFTFVLGRLTL